MRVAVRAAGAAAALVALVACGDGFGGSINSVATAEGHDLGVSQLARWLADVERVPLQRDIAERAAHRWVEFVLFADRVADGDSLLDRETVLYAMWPNVYQELVDIHHDMLIEERIALDSADVDSAYAAGDHRFIYHILISTSPTMAPPDKAAARERAEDLREQLLLGGTWEDANQQNQDPGARQRGGSLGVIVRGETVPQFETVAYSLEPSEISEVTETAFGFHVIRRPPLDEIRDEFALEVEDYLIDVMDTLYLDEIVEEWRIDVRQGAPAALREAAEAPYRAFGSDRVIGSYRGGKFTMADFVRWMQALPPQMFSQVAIADNEQLMELTHSLVRNEVLVEAARDAGAELPEESFLGYREQLRSEVQNVRDALRLDTALAAATTEEERDQAMESVVESYLISLMDSRAPTAVVVPAFLAQRLRSESDWGVSSPGLDQSVERAQRMRMERRYPQGDSVGVQPPAAPSDTAPAGEGDAQ
jgi:peptidyl-prolyl cis-trans isomerase D